MLDLIEHLAEVVAALRSSHHQELSILWILAAESDQLVALQAEGEHELARGGLPRF